MELRVMWDVLFRRWWLVALPALVALVLTLPSLGEIVSPPISYSAVIRFTASQPPPPEGARTFEDQSYIPWLASEYAVINLATWMRTETFAGEIVALLTEQGQALPVDAVRGAINSDAVRSIMTLYLAWPDADQLEAIATAAIRVLRERNEVYFPQFGAQRAQITPLDGVVVTPVSAPLSARLTPLFRVLLGLAAGIGLAFLAEYLDGTLRARHEVEAALGLPVIAEIPPHR